MKRKLTLMKSSSAKPAKPGGNGLMRFAEVFPDPKISTSLMSKLGWTHFLQLIQLDDPVKHEFYAEMCRIERWHGRTWIRGADFLDTVRKICRQRNCRDTVATIHDSVEQTFARAKHFADASAQS